MSRKATPTLKTDDTKNLGASYNQTHPKDDQIKPSKITEGQLEALALRFRSELDVSLSRTGSGATATINENVLSVEIAHSLSAAEHNLMRKTSGRNFFQHYIEQLAEQMYPTFVRHIEDILPISVTYPGVKVDRTRDSIIFSFGIRTHASWTTTIAEANSYRNYA